MLEDGINTIHPFEAFPYERFEGHPGVGRELAMKYCCELIDACRGGVALTGISEGTLIEATYVLENHPNRSLQFYPQIDPLWSDQIKHFADDARFTVILDKLKNNDRMNGGQEA